MKNSLKWLAQFLVEILLMGVGANAIIVAFLLRPDHILACGLFLFVGLIAVGKGANQKQWSLFKD